MNIYISSSCSRKKKIGYAVAELAALGFKNIELTGGTAFYEGVEDDLAALRRKYGLRYLIHNFFPPPKKDFVLNLASRRPDIKEQVSDLIGKASGLLKVFGERTYTVHPGLVNEMFPELKDNFFTRDMSVVNRREDFYEHLGFLSKEAALQDMRIGVENLTLRNKDDKFSFLCSEEEIEQFLNHFRRNERIGMLLDLGHLNVASSILGFDRDALLERIVDRYAEKIFAFHLSDNDGCTDAHAFVPLDSWQLKYLNRHRKVFKGIPAVFEWHNTAGRAAYLHFQKIKDVLSGNEKVE